MLYVLLSLSQRLSQRHASTTLMPTTGRAHVKDVKFKNGKQALSLSAVGFTIPLVFAALGAGKPFLLKPRDVVELRGTNRLFAIVVWRFCPLLCLAQAAHFRTTFKLDDAAPLGAAPVLG